MNQLIKKERAFLKLLLSTNKQQQKAMIKTITTSQMRAMVQIVYNVLQGYGNIPEKDKKRLQKRKRVIRRFVVKGLERVKREKLLLKHLTSILLLIKVVGKGL